MAIPADLDPANVPDSPTQIDPSETLSNSIRDTARLLDTPVLPPPTDHDVGRYLSGDEFIDVTGPAPQTPEGIALMHRKLAWEQENLPARALTPEGQNPRINYGRGETSDGFIKDTGAGVGLAVLQAGADIGRKAAGLGDLAGVPGAEQLAEKYGAAQRGLAGVETGGVPLLRPLVQNVIATAPELVAGAVAAPTSAAASTFAKLAPLATAFGFGSAGQAYETAKEADYPHPEAYAALSGTIAFGTAFLPGLKGRNLVVAANEAVAGPTWQAYGRKLAQDYQTNLWQTHGGSTALMMGVQTTLQGLLDKQTVNPNLTWGDIVSDAAASMGMGAVIGEGFGALGHAATISQHNRVLGDWARQIEQTQFNDWQTRVGSYEKLNQPGSYTGPSLRGGNRGPGVSIMGPMHIPPDESQPSAYDVAQRNRGSLRLPPGMGTQPVSERVRAPIITPEENSYEVARRNAGLPQQGPSQIVVKQPQLTPEAQAIEAQRVAELNPEDTDEDVRMAWVRKLINLTSRNEPIPLATAQAWADKLTELTSRKVVSPEEAHAWVQKLNELTNAPLAPTMDTARRIVEMDPLEFKRRAASFNKINLTIGENATPADVAELEQLRDRAIKRLQEATVKAKSGTDADLAPMIALSTMPQFYNEAIARAKAHGWAKELVGMEPSKIPDWAREEMLRRGLDPARPLNDIDVANPSVKEAVQADPTLTPEQKAQVLKTGSPLPPPTPKATAPVGQLPKKGEKVNLGQYFVTRTTTGKYVLREPGNKETLATLRVMNPLALTQEALLADIASHTKGEKTKYWDIGNRLGKAKEAVKQETLAQEDYVQQVISKLGDSPEEQALKAALHSGALTKEAAIGLLSELASVRGSLRVQGREIAKKGPEGTAKALTQVMDSLVKRYLAGKLLERKEAGKKGEVPIELRKVVRTKADDGTIVEEPTDDRLTEKEVRAKFPDAKGLATRALYIMMRNREIATEEHLSREQVHTSQDEAATERARGSDAGSPTALAPVNKTGFTEPDVVTQFTDEDIAGKEAQAERVNEIKEQVLGGDAAHYDEGIKILTDIFKFSYEKAAQWMDSETTFLGPRFPGEFERGPLRSATETDFKDPEIAKLYKELGLLNSNPVEALKIIAARGDKWSPLAQLLLQHPELHRVTLGNIGGNSRAFAVYNADNDTIRMGTTAPPKVSADKLIEAFLHEAGHAVLAKRYEVLPPNHPLVEELARILGEAKKAYTGDNAEVFYALSTPHELLTMIMSSPELIEFLSTTPDKVTKGSLWTRVVSWVKQLFGRGTTMQQSADKLVSELLKQPPVGKVEWLEQHSKLGTFNYPEIRKVKQYEQAADYAREYTPEEEKIVLTRKAIANNTWLLAPDVDAILSKLPPDVRSRVATVIDQRLDVLRRVQSEPGGDIPSHLQDVLNDPNLDNDRKAEISRSVLANVLWFKHQSGVLESSVLRKIKTLTNDLERLDKGINDSSARMVAGENAIETLVSDFKESVLAEKKKAVQVERTEQLNNQLAMADEMKGNRRSAFHKFMDALAQRIDLETLLSTEDPKALSEYIDNAFPATPENVKLFGVSQDTIQRASLIMARSNSLREELLTLKLLRDEEMKRGVFALNKDINEQVKAGSINKVIDKFTVALRRITTRQERAAAIYRTLYAEKLKRIKAIGKAVNASEALKEVQRTQSFRELDTLVTSATGLLKPMAVRLPSGQMQFTHPLTRDHVVIGYDFQRDGEHENLQKLSDIVDAARLYLANPDGQHYTPEEAAFWRGIVRDSAFMLDPALSYNARKLVGAQLDPYKLVNFTGGALMVPEQMLRRVGGRAANELITGLQALSVVDSQLGNLIRKWNAPMSLSADKAAKAHGMPIEQWHNEVLNPLIASRQTTGYEPLRPGSKTLYGHEILPEDEAAFQAQKSFDRELVAITLRGKGNPAVLADPAKITFKPPGKGSLPLQRPVLATGPDTMSRRIDYQTKNWATQWFNNSEVVARKRFLDAHFTPVVIGHAATIGAPDYAIRSTMPELYRAAMKIHRDSPFETVDDFVDAMFHAQTENVAPEFQMTREGILNQMINELTAVFKKVADYNPGTPKPDVGALLRVVDTDNSFTAERGRLIAPTTFYNYGLTFDGQRIARMHSAKAYYTLNIAGKNGLLDKLISAVGEQRNRFRNDIEAAVRAGTPEGTAVRELKKTTQKAQIKGDLLLNYSETLEAYRKLTLFKAELERMLTKTGAGNDPDARQLAQTAQSFIAANVLAGVQSQNTNAFGGLANLMLIDKMLLGRSAASSILGSAGRTLFTKGPIELAALFAKSHPALAKALTGPMTGMLGEAISARIQMHHEMEAYGLAPAANVRQDMQALWAMPGTGGRPQPSNPTLTQRAARGLETGLGAISTPLSAIAPRLVDRFVNELTVWKARDIEDLLRKNAARYGEARESAGLARTPFTIEEILGTKGASARQDVLLRKLFTRERMSLDDLMWRYYEAYKAAPGDKNAVQFFTPEERAAFQYSLAQDVNLPVFANRPVSGKGSKTRNLLGLFWGFPAWQAGAMSDYVSRASTDKSTARYLPTTIIATLALAALGAASIKVTKELKSFFYNEKNDYPDILAAKDAGDVTKALTVGLATYLPFLGNLINYAVMDNGVRNGFDINSQFVMLNFATDMMATTKRMIQSHDVVRPMEDFVRRWSPLARIVINRLPNQEGLTEYYNLQREARTLAPDGMELKKRGKPSFEATPVTPILQDMVNAAYRGDTSGFFAASQAYLKYQVDHGMSPDTAQQNLRSAWRSRHPFVSNFGRMPTAGEEAVIYSNATTAQQQEITKANQVFQTYGDLLGTHFSVVSTDSAASTGGRASAPALPIVQAPAGARGTSGTGNIGSLIIPAGLTSPLLGGRGGGGSVVGSFGGGSLLGGGKSSGGGGGVGANPFKGPAKATKGGRGRKGSLRISRPSGMTMKIKVRPNLNLSNPRGHSGGSLVRHPSRAPRSLRRRGKK